MSKLNYERAATILAEAAFLDDATVVEKYGITSRTLFNYRRRLHADPQLSALFLKKRAALEREWANELAPAIRETIRFLQQAARSADPSDPHAIHAVAGALKILSEVSMTKEVINARLVEQDRAQLAEIRQVAPVQVAQARA